MEKWKAFWLVVLFVVFGIEWAFRRAGIEFHQIAHLWRYVLIALALVLGVAATFLQMAARRGQEYLVALEFTGERAPAPRVEVALRAHSEEEARARGVDYGTQVLHQHALTGYVTFRVTDCHRR